MLITVKMIDVVIIYLFLFPLPVAKERVISYFISYLLLIQASMAFIAMSIASASCSLRHIIPLKRTFARL